MMSLQKTIGKCGRPGNEIIYHSKGLDGIYPTTIIFIEFEQLFFFFKYREIHHSIGKKLDLTDRIQHRKNQI